MSVRGIDDAVELGARVEQDLVIVAVGCHEDLQVVYFLAGVLQVGPTLQPEVSGAVQGDGPRGRVHGERAP